MVERKILIVDDSLDDIELCIRTLSKIDECKYTVNYETRPASTLKKLQSEQYDCLVVDFHFPASSGLEIIKNIRPEFPLLPVVVLTGQTDQVRAAALIKAGAQDYIKKSNIKDSDLHEVISEAIVRAEIEFKKEAEGGALCNLLIIDDNPDDIEFCIRSLKRKSKRYRYQSATSGEEGLSLIETFLPDCVILDHSLPGTSGVDLLPKILNINPHVPVIIMTGQGNEMIAVEAMKRGAENYLIKSTLDADLLDKNVTAAVEKKQLEQELMRREKALEQKNLELTAAYAFQDMMIESLPDYIFVKDSNFKIVKANKAFINLYPKGANVIGFTTVEDYPDDQAEAFLAKDREAFDKGMSETIETITFPNGEIHILSTHKKRFENEKGEVFILGIARDVTERENMIRELKKSNADLEQFAYIASHDLKSPLNGIKKLVSWIEQDHFDDMPEEAKQHFEMIKSRVNRMSTLLTDLLDYAKINNQLVESETFNLTDVCHSIFSLNGESNTFKLVTENVNINLPRVAFQMVMMNLFGNSIKHHDHTSGEVEVRVAKVSGGYEILVEDNGPGIPEEYAEKVFEMFQTLKSRDEVEGSGMGLALVKKIIEFYGGSVGIDAAFKSGCRVIMFWPCVNNILDVKE